MSYFAKPNFIVYDDWFDDDLEKNNFEVKNKKIKTISNIHEFFYQKSNYKIGGSENNFQSEIKLNEKELLHNYLENDSEKFNSISKQKLGFIEKLPRIKFKFSLTKKLIYSLSVFVFVFILGFIIFFISQSKQNESNISNRFFTIEKEF